MNSNKELLIPIMDIVLRVPPLFVIDGLCSDNMKDYLSSNEHLKMNPEGAAVLYTIFILIVGSSSIIIMWLPTKQLINFYTLVTTFGTLYFSYSCNTIVIHEHFHPDIDNFISPMFHQFWNLVNKWTTLEYQASNVLAVIMAQAFLAKLYCYLKEDFLKSDKLFLYLINQRTLTNGYKIYLLLVSPLMLLSTSLNEDMICFAPIVVLILLLVDMKPVFDSLNMKFLAFRLSLPEQIMLMLRNDSFLDIASEQWTRIHVPSVLRSFSVLQNLTIVIFWISMTKDPNVDLLLLEMMDKSTRTYVSLLCLTSVLSLLAYHIGKFFMKWVGTTREEDQHLGEMVSILFMLLAIQTGLPILNQSKRLIRLYYNLSLTFLASMHYIHNMLHYKLQSISLSSYSLTHFRQLLLGIFLLTSTTFFLIYQLSNNVVSTWLLSVFAFGSELIFKICFSLFIYFFIFIDFKTKFAGEKTDEYVYYMTFFGKLIEFIFGLFLFGNGVWMVLFESAGLLRVVIMCAHLYFNIWKEAKQLYTTCSKKREATTKVAVLKSASIDSIRNYNDVCAICYQNLEACMVKETNCRHLFHESCLCKWIPVSDACPICHRSVFSE